MLYSLSEQIAHCYFRAAECRKLVARASGETDQRFYFEREQAWLSLARRYEFQERLNQTESERRKSQDDLPSTHIRKTPARRKCPSCHIDMKFQRARPVERMSPSAYFFLCPNCYCLTDRVVHAIGLSE